jgi:hypothetical protein
MDCDLFLVLGVAVKRLWIVIFFWFLGVAVKLEETRPYFVVYPVFSGS